MKLCFISKGILVFARPCSIVVDVKELFGAESKSQVYAHVHNLLKKIKDTSKYIFCSYEYYYNSINKVLNVLIGHFRVLENLSFKTSLSAKSLLWKLVLFAS